MASGRKASKIGEFEYAAFSTIWGIPLFISFAWLTRENPQVLQGALAVPMTATPYLFLLGLAIGACAGFATKQFLIYWKNYRG